MINLKLQNMKQAAYFDYFKSFSLNASDTIKKLQLEFKEQIQESFFLDHSMMFKRIKTLLGSYEILIYQINDSCEFVEIPQFGSCILKIFLQIMSVIRFLLHKIVQKSSKKEEPSPFVDRTHSFQKTHVHMNMTHTHLSHDPSLHQQNRLMYKKKEQSKYIINTLNQQLSLLELEQSQNLQASKKQFRSLIQGKEKLQSIEISQNQNILSQALNSFCKKGQHLKTFVNVRQAAMISNMKEGVGEYMKVKDILDEGSNAKLSNASIKLQELFKTHTINYLKEKQSEMVTQQVQVKIEEPLENKILEENKQIIKLNDLLRKVNDQIGFEQQKNKSLENLLKSKNEQFQLKTMQFRVAKVEMENIKAKHEKILQAELNLLNSKYDMCSNCHNKMSSSNGYKKSDADCVSKSIIEEEEENERVNTQQSEQKSDSAIQHPSRLMEKINRKLHYKNQSSLTRKNLAYRKLNSKGEELDIDSLTWEIKIMPEVMVIQGPQSKTRILQRATSGNNSMNNTFSTYKDHRRVKTKNFADSKNQLQIQRVFAFTYCQSISWLTGEPKLLGIRGLNKKKTEASSPDSEFIVKQVTEKWLDNDQVHESVSNGQQDDLGINTTFCRNNLHTEIAGSRDNQFDNKPVHSNSQKSSKDKLKSIEMSSSVNDKQNSTQTLFRKGSSKSYRKLQKQKSQTPTLVHQNQDQFLNSDSRISQNPNIYKFPKFLKFSPQQRITLSIKQLMNLFFDIETAKNFQYINLFQNDQLRVGTAVKDMRKSNQALNANIKQIQKKNFINGLITKVKGKVASRNMNVTSPQRLQSCKNHNQQNVISEFPSMSCTFSGTLMKTQFWEQLQNQKPTQYHETHHHLLKLYDAQTLVAMLFKHLRDLKRTSLPTAPQMTNYELVRNFLRYPYSVITLQNDKTFLQKQRQESGIEYLELRKVMHRVFKLHKNCKAEGCKSSFEMLGMRQFANGGEAEGNDGDALMCGHLVAFYEAVGIVLLPKQGECGNQG